ncbi:cell division protein DivIVA [Humibacillus xanthopallidus]|uniref:cell division protein DivIVA n=1 Tax=Humibacillus xanthopallidus TaxID=412689 RepID=UPI00384E646E
MTWFILFVGVVVVCFVAALVLGLIGAGSAGGLGGGTRSLSHEPLPDDPIEDTDFDDLVFDVGLRGYRMSQVDGVVDRLRRELREKDEEIAVLRGGPSAPVRAEVTERSRATAQADPAEHAAQHEHAARHEQAAQHEQPEPPLGREPRP